MRYTTLVGGALALLSSTPVLAQTASTTLPTAASTSTSQAASQLNTLSQYAKNVTTGNLDNGVTSKRGGCNLSNLKIRREWSTFSTAQKEAYINAVLCLQSKPSRTPSDLVSGARTRYDDFVATHINQTLNIHYTGTFLAWHRYFTWEFEQTLINECGYTGTVPYWNWPASANSLETYSVFDGSATSMSGNGAPRGPNDTDSDIELTLGNYPIVYLPLGTGGGCVTSGPFVNYTVNLGPVALSLPGGATGAAANPLGYNPRCLKRDLTTALIQRYANFTSVVSLILNNNDIADFQLAMQGVPGSGSIGVHGGGHYAMGGDPGRDVFVSPGDPAFWHHHGMIDRVWWIWQTLDLANRQDAISGTNTFLNNPPSANTTLDTVIDLGYAAGEMIAMRELMSTTGGPFCYIYL
ncbi:tyrosinase, putative [Talaromyces stipitatus ATCC 10500]|uniref:Tyrosinase, putative n=1 Tax=Talaromyces stipitatus (strain ATCC 10500 / CBS 375.48 / QM 6759 / NRRL 1006) TaxID=441959 RepID=B8MG02_TALSN|nr:tyrosinase, putative [Talaromyces stipitatus ATCC 10500]EED15869.1 tyrosinase, putative [Talaromyces stipitatus ATCC 10500]